MSRSTFYFLVFCTTVAFFLRWWLMPTHLFFGPEQGRDFLAIRSIVYEKNFTLIGPKTDFNGVFHGPLYYYLSALPFALSRGNPLVVAATLILMQALTVFLAYAAGKEASGKKEVGLIAASLFAVSYGSIVYSRWLTQVPLSIPFTFLFLWALFRFLNGKRRALIGVAVSAGLLGQVQFIFFLFVPIFMAFVIARFRKRFLEMPRLTILLSIASYFLVGGGTYLAFDLRHQFLITKSIIGVFTSKQLGPSLLSAGSEVLKGFVHWVGESVGVPSQVGAVILFIMLTGFLIVQIQKKKWQAEVLCAWIVLPAVVLFLFRRGVLDQLFVGIIPGVIIASAMFLSVGLRRFGRSFLIAALLILVFSNVWQVWKNFPSNTNLFFQAPQPEVRYSDQLALIDEIYKRVGRGSFEVQAYTIPFFWQDAWTYLLWYRGNEKFGGKPPVAHGGEKMFVIIQKDRANRTFQENWYRDIVAKLGKLVGQFTIGEYTVEERRMYL